MLVRLFCAETDSHSTCSCKAHILACTLLDRSILNRCGSSTFDTRCYVLMDFTKLDHLWPTWSCCTIMSCGCRLFCMYRCIVAGSLTWTAICRYYTLKVLLPAQGRQSWVETPQFVKSMVFASGIGTVNPREIDATNPAQAGFRAFRGRGQRLAG